MENCAKLPPTFGIRDPTVVLLSPGAGSAVYSEQSFLARRMGIPVVQGGDLLVLDDCVYLKTVRGLERVEVIYNRVADAWLDPLVFRSDSARRAGPRPLPAQGHRRARQCRRFAARRRPLAARLRAADHPLLPRRNADPAHRADALARRHRPARMVLENLDAYRMRPISRENTSGSWERAPRKDDALLRQEIRKRPSHLRRAAARRRRAHRLFCERPAHRASAGPHRLRRALRQRTSTFFPARSPAFIRAPIRAASSALAGRARIRGCSSDEITNALLPKMARRTPRVELAPRQVTSRVAEAFYWMGRYLERAHHQAYLIQVVETLETEELNSAERKSYRPMWNRLLPPLEKSAGTSRRSIANRLDRYRLVLLPEPGTVVSTFLRAMYNAESVQDSLSPEAWADAQRTALALPAHALPRRSLRAGSCAHDPPAVRRRHAAHPAIFRHRRQHHARGRRLALLRNRPVARARDHHRQFRAFNQQDAHRDGPAPTRSTPARSS
jgi:hypothetical protein